RTALGRIQPRRRYHIPLYTTVCRAKSPNESSTRPGAPCMTTPQAPHTIFIVDDDEAVRDSLRWLLEANGYRVRSFSGAEEFLESYDPEQVGVLIADVRMPGMSGLELQEELIARKAPLPIVFITGHGDVPMAVSTIKKGAVDFLEKPFNESDLRNIVERMLQHANERATQAQT